jgi:uncharacterized protein
MAEFEIKLTELESGAREYDLPIRAAWLCEQLPDLAPEDHPVADRDGRLEVVAEKSGGEDVLVRGRAEATVFVPCGRCLSPAEVKTASDIAVLFSRRAEAARPSADDEEDDGSDLSPEEEDRETFTGELIVLDEVVREHLVLELPMQPLCRPDCPGIEVPASVKGPARLDAVPGAPDIDPRLAPLLALSKRDKAQS